MGAPPTTGRQRPFDAVAADEIRRREILKKLKEAPEAYLESCSRRRDVGWDRVCELLGAACRSFYDSLATSYLSVEPPIDPEELFGVRGELFGGCTRLDFERAATTIKIQTPSHWPPPQMWREGDPPEMIRDWIEISRDINADVRLGPHLEGGWLNDYISEGIEHWRPQFERRFAKHQKPRGGHDVETVEQRSARRRKIVDPWLKEAKITSPEMWASNAGGNMDKNTPRDYLNGKTKALRDENRKALARPLGKRGDELPI